MRRPSWRHRARARARRRADATAAIFARGRTLSRSRVKNETSASGSAPAASSALAGSALGLGEHLLRIERRNVGGELGHRERQIARDANEGTHAHDLAVAAAAGRGGHPDDLARGVGLAGRRQAIGLAGHVGDAIGDAADGAAQRGFHPLRHGGEIGLAIERGKNGAAHQGRAAKTGENGAAEPLHRDAAAVDQPARLAVDRQRRLVAEIDALGLQARTKCPASSALIQARRPLRPHRGRSTATPQGAKRDRDDWR